jgi:hypothetical protein
MSNRRPAPNPVRRRGHRLAGFTRLVLVLSLIHTSVFAAGSNELELAGVTVTPHVIASAMRYRRDPDPELGARVQLFVRNPSQKAVNLAADTPIRLREKSPDELLAQDEWSWHDFPSAWPKEPLALPPESLTAWSFNGKRSAWGIGKQARLVIGASGERPEAEFSVDVAAPTAWISAATFLAHDGSVTPDAMVLHVANERDESLSVISCRLWLPKSNQSWRTFYPMHEFANLETWPVDGVIPPHDRAMLRVRTGPLPLTYAVIELRMKRATGEELILWSHLRVKREAFDISGGWVQGGKEGRRTMTFEPFLKTLKRMHINTAHLADQFPGYTDQTAEDGLYTRYPLKFFNKLVPRAKYESAEMLPRIHAVEFLGEPQYGGGRPVPPMEVWRQLAPYQTTKLPTTVTHSEERIWRYYAGLSDFPHYDAYRVCAPSPDAWSKYDRWDGKSIRWGAPLETIGDMCRSLRELNRPMPTAYWSQGPHAGWNPAWGRHRASPTPDELRMQAYHALSSRITSLYWFNLSLPSLVKYRDTLDELTRVGREIRMLSPYYLSGNAYGYERVLRDGKPDWDLASIVSPEATLLFALDLDYYPDPEKNVFQFRPPREVRLSFRLPPWARSPVEVFRLDADGTYDVAFTLNATGIDISDTLHKVGVYVVAPSADTRAMLERKRQELLAYETGFDFNPATSDADFAQLVEFARETRGDL